MRDDVDIEAYAASHSDPEDDYLYRLWRATNIHTVHGFMASGHLQGRLLKLLVMMQRPQYILEVGTFSGYSAICMAEGLKELDERNHNAQSSMLKAQCSMLNAQCSMLNAQSSKLNAQCSMLNAQSSKLNAQSSMLNAQSKVFTFEINDEMEDFTRPWIEGSGVAEYIDFRIGDAIEEAPKLGVKFDMAFIDGDKRTYCETYDAVFPLMSDGGIILADNTLWDGHVTDHAYDRDSQTLGIRRFNDYIAQDRRVEKVIIPIRDGLTIIRKK